MPDYLLSTLPNKLRVATIKCSGDYSALGFYIQAGTCHETPETAGVGDFLSNFAFLNTTTRTQDDMSHAMKALSSHLLCDVSRECITFRSSHVKGGTSLALSLIADTILNPSFLPDEFAKVSENVLDRILEEKENPNQDLSEIVHSVAYNRRGLGNFLHCTEERHPFITLNLVKKTWREWYRPERMVVVGIGLNHDELVADVKEQFATYQPLPLLYTWTPPRSTYSGGYRFIHDPSPTYCHVWLVYEGISSNDDDNYVQRLLKLLLGEELPPQIDRPEGETKTHTRLYKNILDRYPQVSRCGTMDCAYTSSSLFGIFATFDSISGAPAEDAKTDFSFLSPFVNQLGLLANSYVPVEELEWAKSVMLDAFEGPECVEPSFEVDNLGLELLMGTKRVTAAESISRIKRVTQDDVQRVARRICGRIVGNEATVVFMGQEDIVDWNSLLEKAGIAGLE